MKIFVSSTVKDLGDLRDELYRRLKELGHTPWLSEMNDFPINRHPDSMTNCIMVAEECDLFVVLLDKRGGLSYTKEGGPYPDLSGLKISEAEYRCARKKGKPVCIFIRKRAEYESAIYRQMKDSENEKKLIQWYSETSVYEFYDLLMHEQPHIPWRYTFDSFNDIMEPLNAIIGDLDEESDYSQGNDVLDGPNLDIRVNAVPISIISGIPNVSSSITTNNFIGIKVQNPRFFKTAYDQDKK